MPVTNVNHYLHKLLPALLLLIVASLGMTLPGVQTELYSFIDEISIETITSENGDPGKYTPSFPSRLSRHPRDKGHVSFLCAVDSANNFLRYSELVRAPPQRYLDHS
jgi:hypothetical protein